MPIDALLDPRQLVALARRNTGLYDFDELPLDEPLQRLCAALRTEANLDEAGGTIWHRRLLDTLETRLRAQDWFARRPEILEEKIVAPLIVLGVSRTGTTLLQRLLSMDARFYSGAWWEVRFPVPAPDDIAGARRIEAAKAEVAAVLRLSPELAAVHPWDALGADEDIMLLEHTLLTTVPESLACIPGFFAWQKTQDLVPAYRYYVKLLQLLQWQKKQRGIEAERWLLKTPMHLAYVDIVDRMFPDAQYIQTHRDPLRTVPSFASMVHSLWSRVSATADPIEAGRQAAICAEFYLNGCIETRDALAAGKFIDIDFRDTASDPLGVVGRIYRELGMPMTDIASSRIEGYMRAHPRDARPSHHYTLEQFGLSQEDIERRFAAYRRRYSRYIF
jgi:hypothetical protein